MTAVEKRLSKEAILSLLINTCFQFGFSMSMVFLNLYLWRLTNSLWVSAMYNGVFFLTLAFVFLFAGWWAKKRDRVVIYRAGILLNALFYFCVVLSGETIADYFYFFAIFAAFGTGFYFAGFFTIVHDVTDQQNRLRYMGLQSVTANLSQMIGPAMAGVVISYFDQLKGYGMVFGVVYILFFAAFIGSFWIKVKETHHKAYYIRYTRLIMQRCRSWKMALFSHYFIGLLEGVLMFLPPILLFSVFHREDTVGYLNFFFYTISMLFSYLMSRFAKNEWIRHYLMITSFIFALGAAVLIIGIHVYTVVAFMILVSTAKPLHRNFLQTFYYQTIDRLPLKGHLKVESVVLMEVFINAGRVTSAVIVAFMAGDLGDTNLVVILISVSLLQFVIVKLLNQNASFAKTAV